jgi:hypothetical protein
MIKDIRDFLQYKLGTEINVYAGPYSLSKVEKTTISITSQGGNADMFNPVMRSLYNVFVTAKTNQEAFEIAEKVTQLLQSMQGFLPSSASTVGTRYFHRISTNYPTFYTETENNLTVYLVTGTIILRLVYNNQSLI